MATLDLGKIKFVWKGAYASGTTYEVDDVVSYQGSSYIYKNATAAAGNVPTLTTHWDSLAQGTDLSSLSTGAVAYKTAGGVSGLTSNNAGELLQSGGAGVAPSYVSPSTVAKKAESVKKLNFNGKRGGYFKASVITNDNELHSVGMNSYGSAGIASYTDHGNFYRSIVLPDHKIPNHVIDVRYQKWVVTEDNCLYACGYNQVQDLGFGLTYGGGRNSTSPAVAAEDTTCLTRVEFPTVNYPLTGQSQVPQIVSVFKSDFVYADGASYQNNGVAFAVDTLGYLWAWGFGNSRAANENLMGLGWGNNGNQGLNYQYCPVRVPSFLPSTVGATAGSPGFSQPNGTAATGTAIKVIKVEGNEAVDSFAALVDPTTMPSYNDNPNLNLYYWGPNGSGMFPGTSGTPIPLAKTALGLSASSSDYVRDVVITQTAAAGSGAGFSTIYILLNSGRLFTRGYNVHGQCANGGFGVSNTGYGEVAAPSGLTWAVPPLWDLSTAETYRNSIKNLDSTLVVYQGCAYAKLSNGTWRNWGYNPVGNLARGENDSTSRNLPGDFSLYNTDFPRSGQTLYNTGGSDYGQANILASNALTTASGTYISKVSIGGQNTAHVVWVTVVTPAQNKIVFYACGYNYWGSCGNVQAYSQVPFWDTASYSWASVTKANWNRNFVFRMVPTPASFTLSNVSDWLVSPEPGSHAVTRVLLATGELYACGFSANANVNQTANNAKNVGSDTATQTHQGYTGTNNAAGIISASTAYMYLSNGTVNRLTRVAIGH